MPGLLDLPDTLSQTGTVTPAQLGLLGLISGIGQASMPSRLPVPTGAVFAQGLGGFAQGYGQGLQNSLAQQQAEGARLQNANSLINLNIWRAAMGQPALSEGDLLGGGGTMGAQPGSGQSGMQGGGAASAGGNAGSMLPAVAAANRGGPPSQSGTGMTPAAYGATLSAPGAPGGVPASGGAGAGNSFMGINLPSGMSPLAYLTLSRLNPQAAGRVIGNQYPGPTDLSRLENERAAIAAGNPQDSRLAAYDAMIAHAVGAPTGYELGANGGFQVDPGYVHGQGAISSAQAWGKAPAEAWTSAMKPVTLRGQGSTYINPYFGQTVQVPNELNFVNPQTLGEYKAFVPLGLRVTGNGPMNSAAGVTGPSAMPNGAPAAAPAAMPAQAGPAAAPPAGASSAAAPGGTSLMFSRAPQSTGNVPPAAASTPSPNAGAVANGAPSEGTPFLTGAPPGQEEIIKGLANNYGEEGRKGYESAVSGLGSLAFIDRDIDKLGPTGFQAMGEGADARNQLVKEINSIGAVAGVPNIIDPNKVASWEDFRKETTLLGMKGLASIFGGSREAASIITTSIHAVPNTENSYVGARLLTNAYKEGFQREVDLRNYETNWIQSHGGNLTGAKEAFNQQFPPQAYSWRAISKVQPYTVTSPDDLKRFLPGTYFRGPSGKLSMIPGTQDVPLAGALNGQ